MDNGINEQIPTVVDSLEKTCYDIYNFSEGGLANGRDLGGTVTSDGRRIKHGRLIRSGKLYKLNKKEVRRLADANIKVVVDLRMDNERDTQPDMIPQGAAYYHIPVVCVTTPGITREKSMYKVMRDESELLKKIYKDGDEYMMKLYEHILVAPEIQVQIKKSLDVIMNADGCVLFHCAAGKDRAGILAMLIEAMLGVSDEEIIDDYLKSQKSKVFIKRLQKIGLSFYTALTLGFRFKAILFAMIDTKREYIEHVINLLNHDYGSIKNYCVKALGITEEQIQSFKEKNLEKNPE